MVDRTSRVQPAGLSGIWIKKRLVGERGMTDFYEVIIFLDYIRGLSPWEGAPFYKFNLFSKNI